MVAIRRQYFSLYPFVVPLVLSQPEVAYGAPEGVCTFSLFPRSRGGKRNCERISGVC